MNWHHVFLVVAVIDILELALAAYISAWWAVGTRRRWTEATEETRPWRWRVYRWMQGKAILFAVLLLAVTAGLFTEGVEVPKTPGTVALAVVSQGVLAWFNWHHTAAFLMWRRLPVAQQDGTTLTGGGWPRARNRLP
jgi:hypothetical protein